MFMSDPLAVIPNLFHVFSYVSGMEVWFGTTHSGLQGEHGQAIPVIEYIMNPQYNTYDVTVGYDISLIKLQHAPNIDNYTRPICLGSVESWQYILEMGEAAECYITGFGSNEIYMATGKRLLARLS